MEKNSKVSFTFGAAFEEYEDGRRRATPLPPKLAQDGGVQIMSGIEFIQWSGATNRVPTPTAIVRTSVLKLVGGYNRDLPHTGDMEMWLRLAAYGDVGIISRHQAVYRRHDANMSRTYFDNYLPDLSQRQAAIDSFVEAFRHSLPNLQRFQEAAYHELGLVSLAYGHMAFEMKSPNTARLLLRFGNAISPRIAFSQSWIKLVIKIALGPRCFRVIKGVLEAFAAPIRRLYIL
jgi:hypothetical protein